MAILWPFFKEHGNVRMVVLIYIRRSIFAPPPSYFQPLLIFYNPQYNTTPSSYFSRAILFLLMSKNVNLKHQSIWKTYLKHKAIRGTNVHCGCSIFCVANAQTRKVLTWLMTLSFCMTLVWKCSLASERISASYNAHVEPTPSYLPS